MRKSRNKMQPEISPGHPRRGRSSSKASYYYQWRGPFVPGASLKIKEENGDWVFRRLERVTLLARGPSTLMASTFRERTSVCRDGSIDKDSDRSNAQYVCPPLCPEIGTSRSGQGIGARDRHLYPLTMADPFSPPTHFIGAR